MYGVSKVSKPKVKRNRVALSCEPCRKKKIKCNREKPYCDQCIKAKAKDGCRYQEVSKDFQRAKYEINSFETDTKIKLNDTLKSDLQTPILTKISAQENFRNNINGNQNLKNLHNITDNISFMSSIPSPMNGLASSSITSSNPASISVTPSCPGLTVSCFSSESKGNPAVISSVQNFKHFSSVPGGLPPIQSLNIIDRPFPSMQLQKPVLVNLIHKLKTASDDANGCDTTNEISHVNQSLNNYKNYQITQSNNTLSDLRSTSASVKTPSFANNSSNSVSYDLFTELNISENDDTSFYDGCVPMVTHFSRIHNHGPLTWISLLLKDQYASEVRNKVMKKMENIFYDDDKCQNRDKMIMVCGIEDVKPLPCAIGSSKDFARQMPFNKSSKEDDKVMDKESKDGNSNEEDLIGEILKVLPNKKVVWALVKRFFQYVYPFLPYIDESLFIEDISKLLKSNVYTDKNCEMQFEEILINKKLDFATAGVVLLVLKFAENSLIMNDETIEDVKRTAEEAYLMEHPLGKNVFLMAAKCLKQFHLITRCALPVFQFALLMRKYEILYGIDDGSNPEHQIFIATLCQIGTSIGLNRDPIHFDKKLARGKIGNIWRKIWYGLVSLDIRRYACIGAGKILREGYYDTQLPIFDEDSSNIENLDLERIVIDKLKLNHEFDMMAVNLTDYVSSFVKRPHVAELMEKLIEFEKKIFSRFGSLKQILQGQNHLFTDKIKKVWDCTIFLKSAGLLVSCYYHLFLHFQNGGNFKAAKFIKGKFFVSAMDILGNFPALARSGYKYFGIGFDGIYNQCMLPPIHKGMLLLLSLYLAVLITIEKNKDLPEKTQTIKLLNRIVNHISNFKIWYLPCMKALAKRHFYAWKLFKVHTFILSIFKENEVETFKPLNVNNVFDHSTEWELINFLEFINVKNYSVEGEESELFKSLKDNILRNKTVHLNNQIHSISSTPTTSSNEAQIGDLDGIVANTLDGNDYEEDKFWRDWVNSNATAYSNTNNDDMLNNIFLDSTSVTTSPMSLPKEYNNDILDMNREEMNGVNTDKTRKNNLFVDQTIYNMFN